MSLRVFVGGAIGSGKSHYLRVRWLPACQVPVIVFDMTGEWETDCDAVVPTARAAVRAVLAGATRVALSPADPATEGETLASILVPLDPRGPSLGRALGGVGVLCDEADLWMPNGRTPPVVVNAYRRCRHHEVTFLMGTQRPAAVDRMLTGMSEVIAAGAVYEPRDRDYFAAILPPSMHPALATLPLRDILEYTRADGVASWLTPDGAGGYDSRTEWHALAGETIPLLDSE